MKAVGFAGEVGKDGKFHPDSPPEFYAEFSRKKGKRLVVWIKEFRRTRTNPQNRDWWGVVCRMFADKDAMACSPEEAHEALKAELNSDIRVIGDRIIRIPHSTADLDWQEFKDLIAKAHQLGAELYGLNIPDPDSAQAKVMMEERLIAREKHVSSTPPLLRIPASSKSFWPSWRTPERLVSPLWKSTRELASWPLARRFPSSAMLRTISPCNACTSVPRTRGRGFTASPSKNSSKIKAKIFFRIPLHFPECDLYSLHAATPTFQAR